MQEERGFPLPKEPNSGVEEDCAIAEVGTDCEILEPSVGKETSGGDKDEDGLVLFAKSSWLIEDSENLERLPGTRAGLDPLKVVKSSALSLEESGENENTISEFYAGGE